MIPDLSVLWVIALFLLCVFVLNTLIFKPILAMSESRARAVRDARELAASAAQKAAEASTTFDRTLSAARAEVYGQMDEARRSALAQRAAQYGRDEAGNRTRPARRHLPTGHQANAARRPSNAMPPRSPATSSGACLAAPPSPWTPSVTDPPRLAPAGLVNLGASSSASRSAWPSRPRSSSRS